MDEVGNLVGLVVWMTAGVYAGRRASQSRDRQSRLAWWRTLASQFGVMGVASVMQWAGAVSGFSAGIGGALGVVIITWLTHRDVEKIGSTVACGFPQLNSDAQ